MLNRAILMGRLTKDPELKYTTSNIPVCTFTIAVDRNFTKQGEEKKTDFLPIVAWRSNAEFAGKYFTKGRMVVVSGRLQTRTWDDQEGKRHYMTEIVADETYFADTKKKDNNNGSFNNNNSSYSNNNSSFNNNNNDFNAYNTSGNGVQDFNKEIEGFMPITEDDDLPF